MPWACRAGANSDATTATGGSGVEELSSVSSRDDNLPAYLRGARSEIKPAHVSLERGQQVNRQFDLVHLQEIGDGEILLREGHHRVHSNVLREHLVNLLSDNTTNTRVVGATNLLPLLCVLVRLHCQLHESMRDLVVVDGLDVNLDALV